MDDTCLAAHCMAWIYQEALSRVLPEGTSLHLQSTL